MNIEIANRLLQLRKQNNLSQEELAAKIGISRQAVSKWERAEASPDTDNLLSLAKLYNVSIDDLLKSDDEFDYDYVLDNNGEAVVKKEESVSEESRENSQITTVHDKRVEAHEEKKEGSKPFIEEFKRPNMFSYPIIATGIFLILGLGLRIWHPTWLLFLTIPLYLSIVENVNKGKSLSRMLVEFPYPVFVAVVYLFAGFCFRMWHPAWILFLTIPLYYPVVANMEKGKTLRQMMLIFPFPVLVTMVYLLMGFYFKMWHPGWIVFLTIPVYYIEAAKK